MTRSMDSCVPVSLAVEVVDRAGHVFSDIGDLPLPTVCDQRAIDRGDGRVLYLDPLVPEPLDLTSDQLAEVDQIIAQHAPGEAAVLPVLQGINAVSARAWARDSTDKNDRILISAYQAAESIVRPNDTEERLTKIEEQLGIVEGGKE